ncbi:hypothetical protein TNCV_2464351 [Trichonephila clavipes]|nr:hypothetical protein TNCV_2464351 [Trichonephila clavipes]
MKGFPGWDLNPGPVAWKRNILPLSNWASSHFTLSALLKFVAVASVAYGNMMRSVSSPVEDFSSRAVSYMFV